VRRAPCSSYRLDDVFSVEYQPLAVPYLTPPYIDNHPEVVQRDLHPAGDEELKFVILATDGREFLPYSRCEADTSMGPHDLGRGESPVDCSS